MPLTQVMPIMMGALVAVYAITIAAMPRSQRPSTWAIPACLACALLLWTLKAALQEGATGFWPEHTRNLWGNQIWFDLLLAAALALTFMIPRARAVGMRTVPWTLLVLASGSIGLLALYARIIYLEAAVSASMDKHKTPRGLA